MSFLETAYYCVHFPAAVQLYCYQQGIAILSTDTLPPFSKGADTAKIYNF